MLLEDLSCPGKCLKCFTGINSFYFSHQHYDENIIASFYKEIGCRKEQMKSCILVCLGYHTVLMNIRQHYHYNGGKRNLFETFEGKVEQQYSEELGL